MKVEVHLGIGYTQAIRADVLEFDDDVSDDGIESAVQDWADDYVETWWEKKEKK